MTETTKELPAGPRAMTTHRREWWGWLGVIQWLVLMMYAFSSFSLPSSRNDTVEAHNFNLYFILIFLLAIVVLGFGFGKDPGRLSDIARYTTPIAIVSTVVFPLLPLGAGMALYLLCPALMAPALVRRAFGVLYTAPKGRQLTHYISAYSFSYIGYSLWLTANPPKEFAFLFPALLAIPAWWGIRRTVHLTDVPAKNSFVFSWKLILGLLGAGLLLLWLAGMNGFIFTNIFRSGLNASDTVITLLIYSLPGLSYLLYAFVSDQGQERAGLTISVMLFISGIFIALWAGDTLGAWRIPLTIAITVGGSYFEFLLLTLPIYFFSSVKRPLFAGSLGVAIELIFAALLWKPGFWFPSIFWSFGPPLLYSAAFSTVAFVILITFLYERYREKSLAAVLHTLLYKEQRRSPKEIEIEERRNLEAFALTPKEIEVALLLVEGKTRSEITRKLRLPSSEATQLIHSIKDKISGGEQNPIIAQVVKCYSLTRREAEMLPYLQEGMSNQQIADELFLSESTVKNHMYSLVRKLPVKSPREVSAWLETLKTHPS